MTFTARGLGRATLARQLLLAREPVGVEDAVRRLLALQAQHAASPYLALWARLAAFDPGRLDAALADGTLVKATLLRTTLHVVHAEDHRTLHLAMRPTLRAAGLDDRRFTGTGLSVADCDALVPGLLALASEPRTLAQIGAWLGEQLGERVGAQLGDDTAGVLRALRCYAPLVHAPTGGPWSFGTRPSYVAARTPVTPEAAGSPDDALGALVRRYLAGYGPATVADVAQFARVPRARARAAMEGLCAAGPVVEVDGPAGPPLFDVVGGPDPGEDVPAPPRLLGMWDSVLLAHADRSRIVPPEYRTEVTRVNGDVLPTLLVDGRVAGVWRPVDGGIEATAFQRLPDDAWDGLEEEARSLVALLGDRDPDVYRRYGRWWASLPAAQARVLGGG